MATDEQVLCLCRSDLEKPFGHPLPQGNFSGPRPEVVLRLPQLFLPRSVAEIDPLYKQLIPYQLFACQDRYFVYQRGGGVGEGRLAGRLSLGIGGHINLDDATDGRLSVKDYYAALHRERQEELICPAALAADFLGWINDDSDPVGQVHLGSVHLCLVGSEEEMRIRPHGDIQARGWWLEADILRERARFEKWSLLALASAERQGHKNHGKISVQCCNPCATN